MTGCVALKMRPHFRCWQIKHHTPKEQGFSLIETLVVITIVAIAAGMAVPNLLSYQPKYQFNRAVNDIYSNLQWARLTAIRENASCRVVFDETNHSYSIILNPNSLDPPQLRSTTLSEYNREIHLSPSGVDRITYNPRGTGSSGTIVVSIPYRYCEDNDDCCVCITASSSGRLKKKTKTYPNYEKDCKSRCP